MLAFVVRVEGERKVGNHEVCRDRIVQGVEGAENRVEMGQGSKRRGQSGWEDCEIMPWVRIWQVMDRWENGEEGVRGEK